LRAAQENAQAFLLHRRMEPADDAPTGVRQWAAWA
jgi:hypothetical protein